MILGPYALALVTLPWIGNNTDDVPLWLFILLVVAFDVAHVWATLYLSYLDRNLMRRRRALFLWPIPVSFSIAFFVHHYSSGLYWTLLAYIAIIHFVTQQWGIVALYKRTSKDHRPLDYYLDKLTIWTGALGPLLLWHATPGRELDWFDAGEQFIVRLPPEISPFVYVTMAVTALAYVARQVVRFHEERVHTLGKNLWIFASWTSWSVGISDADHPLISAAVINLLHGIPFLVLVWNRCNQRWEGKQGKESPFLAWISQRRTIVLFYGFVLGIALIEELLWDGLVWRVYLGDIFILPSAFAAATAQSIVVALLSVPQIVHYFLDGFIWKLDGSNPDLDAPT